MFFEEHVNSAQLHRQLVALLRLSDFDVSKGTLEVFPNPGVASTSKGMGLRLPLQHGWAWLSKRDLDVVHERYEMAATKALEWFLDLLDSDANPIKVLQQMAARIEELERSRAAARAHAIKDKTDNVVPIRKGIKLSVDTECSAQVKSVFGHVPPGMNPDNWLKGRKFHEDGLTGPSQRAEAIFCLGHYFFYGDPSRDLPALGYGFEEERGWAIKEYLQARHNGYSRDISRGRADATAQVDRAANWRPADKRSIEPKKYSAVRPISWVRENANRKLNARKRIQEALNSIKKLQRSFTTVELQKAAKCSRETLYNHQDIWRNDYDDLAAGFFAICTDENNAVVEAACPESKPPSTVTKKITPPGLLAARRIIYELSMRTKRDIETKQKVRRVSSEAADQEWRDKVSSISKEVSFELPVPKLKSYLLVLANYLSLAPCEEDALPLHGLISSIRQELALRSHGPAP